MKLISDELVDEIGRLLDIGMREGWQAPREMLRNLSEAKMLDLGEVESHPIVEWYTMWGASDEEALVRLSDLSNLLPPVIGREELVAIADLVKSCIERMDSGDWGNSGMEHWPELATAVEILDRIKGKAL